MHCAFYFNKYKAIKSQFHHTMKKTTLLVKPWMK